MMESNVTSEYANLSSFEQFCGNSPIWDDHLLLDGSYPHFTTCFSNVILIWTPCILFLLLSLPYALYLRANDAVNSLHVSFLNLSKTVCSFALFVCSVAELIVKSGDAHQDDIPDALYVSQGLKAACFIVTTFLIQYCRARAVGCSLFLWVFWVVLTLSSIVPFYTNIIEHTDQDDRFSFVLFYVYFALLVILLLLSCFTETAKAKKGYARVDGNTYDCPLLTASVPSTLSIWWMTRLVIRGYQKPLDETDVFELPPADRSSTVVPALQKGWEREKEKVDKYNEKIRPFIEGGKLKSKGRPKISEKSPLLKDRGDGKDVKKEEKKKKEKSPYRTTSLVKVLFKTFGAKLILAQIGKTLADMLSYLTPKISESLLDYVGNRDEEQAWKGYSLAMAYFCVNLIVSVVSNQCMLLSRRVGMRMKSAMIAAIYAKSLTAASSDVETTSGEVVNLMSVDAQRVEDVCLYLYALISTPFQLVLCLILLYQQLGNAIFAGIAVMLLGVPINSVIGVILRKSNVLLMKIKDQRMRLMNEVLAGMKVLKLYAWEGSFEQKLKAIRKRELAVTKKLAYTISVIVFVFNVFPYLVQLTSFAVYTAISDDGYLSPTVAFVSLQLFNMLNIPLTTLPLLIPMVVQAGISIGRISNYLNRDDIKNDVVIYDKRARNAVEIKDGTFSWEANAETPTLKNIQAQIPEGGLVAVVGSVGCGKSSLLSAILGEMEKVSGQVTVKSSIAYVPQEAWIQNATLRNNILFGSDYEHRKYNKIIEACALKSDLEILPGGDRTEIGEKGINVSGGQKQRVSLARAVYSNRDIFLLDDPLSAVDSHVGKHIFNEVIGHQGLLKEKTRILVTHGIHWLPKVDQILVMADGAIREFGTFDELMAKGGAFAEFLAEHVQENWSESAHVEDPEVSAVIKNVRQRLVSRGTISGLSSDDEKVTSLSDRSGAYRRKLSSFSEKKKRKSVTYSRETSTVTDASLEASIGLRKTSVVAPVVGEKLVEDEKGETGKVKLEIYKYYFQAAGTFVFIGALIIYVCYAGSNIFSAIWLSKWTSDSLLANTSLAGTSEYKDRSSLYLGVYGAGGVAQGVFILIFAMVATVKLTDAAGYLHNTMLENVVRSPMSFFDTTPGGRIVNRFSRDVDVADNTLPNVMRSVVASFGRVTIALVNITYSTPIFLAALAPLAIIYILVQMVYIPTSRQLRRIDSITRSPIYTHFSETLNGAASVRAYRAQDRFCQESKARVDKNFKFYFAGISASTWLSFRLQFLGNLIVLAAALFAITSTNIDAGLVGLSISYASQVTGSLEFMVNMLTEIETNIVSVERMKEYIHTPREADWINHEHRPEPGWPHEGLVTFKDYQTRYREGLDLVLKNMSCQIKGGEKIGIVGRTGAGKSSMTVALFRIIEAGGGKIVIDGHEIASLGLHDLRSKLTILPQEPVIFSGTLRMNLDPFEQYSDAAMWKALEHAYLKTFVEGLPQGLDYECGEGGSNLSVGQRQLVCLARTLLRKTKILVLDEATAAVDFETDELIQKTIREQFKDTTILTIAHRLNTILDYDRVMVLDKGEIKEFDSPQILLEDKTTIFHGMAKDAGLVSKHD